MYLTTKYYKCGENLLKSNVIINHNVTQKLGHNHILLQYLFNPPN